MDRGDSHMTVRVQMVTPELIRLGFSFWLVLPSCNCLLETAVLSANA